MIVTATEFKSNLGKYLDMSPRRMCISRRTGRTSPAWTSPSSNKLAVLDELVGIASRVDADEDTIRKERLARQ